MLCSIPDHYVYSKFYRNRLSLYSAIEPQAYSKTFTFIIDRIVGFIDLQKKSLTKFILLFLFKNVLPVRIFIVKTVSELLQNGQFVVINADATKTIILL